MTPFLAGLRYESRVARTVSCVETRRLQFCAVPEEADSRISNFLRSIRVPNAVLAATPSVRSMAPSKRRKTSGVSQPASGNASFGVRTRRSASTPGDLPDAPDADLDAEPEELMCPITRTMFRDPVVVVDSGHTYERSAILSHFRRNGAKDPLTGLALSSKKVMTIWAVRQIVQAWLDKHPGVTPDGWDSRELLEPSKGGGTRVFDDKGDVGVLRTWRDMCPELQDEWPEDEPVEQWSGVTMDNGRVVVLKLQEFGLTGALVDRYLAQRAQGESLRMRDHIAELETTRSPERAGRLMDNEAEDSFERLRTSGYM